MRKSLSRLALAGAICLMASGLAQAQTAAGAFDGKKFFEELSSRGVNTKGLDAGKFFEELASKAVSSKALIDPQKFFEELASRGVNTQGFDANKFFQELSSRGVKMPDMMVVKSTQ